MFNLDAWSAAVAADKAISRHREARVRWAGIAQLANSAGIVAESLATISGIAGCQADSNKAVSRLLTTGYLIQTSRGHGGRKNATTNVYQLAIPNINGIGHSDEKTRILILARQLGEALLQFADS